MGWQEEELRKRKENEADQLSSLNRRNIQASKASYLWGKLLEANEKLPTNFKLTISKENRTFDSVLPESIGGANTGYKEYLYYRKTSTYISTDHNLLVKYEEGNSFNIYYDTDRKCYVGIAGKNVLDDGEFRPNKYTNISFTFNENNINDFVDTLLRILCTGLRVCYAPKGYWEKPSFWKKLFG